MTAALDAAFANKLVNTYFGGPTVARPPILWAQLCSTLGTATVKGTPILARIAVPNDSTHFPAATGGATTNGTDLLFGSTAGQTLSPTLSVEYYDAPSGGLRSAISSISSQDVSDHSQVRIAAGTLSIAFLLT